MDSHHQIAARVRAIEPHVRNMAAVVELNHRLAVANHRRQLDRSRPAVRHGHGLRIRLDELLSEYEALRDLVDGDDEFLRFQNAISSCSVAR